MTYRIILKRGKDAPEEDITDAVTDLRFTYPVRLPKDAIDFLEDQMARNRQRIKEQRCK